MKRIAGCLGIACLFVGLLFGCSKPENQGEGQQTGGHANESPSEIANTGSEYFTNSIGMKFKLIPAGSFLMGLPEYKKDRKANEGPQHRVKLSQPFYLGICEVTQEQYKKVMGSNPSKHKVKNKPVVSVSWVDTQTFCEKLSKIENREYRLPTEAEWEYACRAGTQTKFFWGDVFDTEFAWCKENSADEIHEVETRKPNAWGLYDMNGNVAEWCSDWYGYRYPSSDEEVDPLGVTSGTERVIRGGHGASVQGNCRSASRAYGGPSLRGDALGFRVVLVPSVGEVTTSTQSGLLEKETEPQTEVGTDESPHIVRGEVFINPIGMEFRNIPASSFLMGFPKGKETPIHSFYLGIHEVTQEQYEKVMGTNPSYFKGATRPVEMVSWDDAQIFCQKLSQQEKDRTYRLPTEAEWEYAVRAGTQTDYFFGDDDASLVEYGWYEENSCGGTTVVGTRKPNPWGLFDMYGNVWELCADRYANYPFPESEQVDINDPTIRTSCVIRGGSWDSGIPMSCRSVSRSTNMSYGRSTNIGFRVVAVPAAERIPFSGPEGASPE